jgi:hypothetical protein
MKTTTPSRRTILILALALFAAVWLLSANSLSNGFTLDDVDIVVNNSYLHTDTPLSTVFSTSYRAGMKYADGLYRPLVILSLMLNTDDPSHPFPFHFFNVTINALNTMLFFLLILGISGNLILAACAALIFGFHPIHTEAVANIAGRPELMYVFFLFIAWIILEKYRARAWSSPAAALALFASLLSKETAVVFPFMVLAGDLLQRRPLFTKAAAFRYLPLAGVMALYLVIRHSVLGHYPDYRIPPIDNPVAYSPLVERVATTFTVLVRYIVQLFFPLRLASDYSYNEIPSVSSFLKLEPLLGFLLLAGLIITAVVVRRRNMLISLAVTFFLFPYILVSNIFFPIGTIMGERLMYFPVAGFALGASLLVTPLLKKRNIAVTGLLGMVMLLYSARTVTRNRHWHDDELLFRTDVKTVPNNTKLITNHAIYLKANRHIQEAERELRKAIDLNTPWPITYLEMSSVMIIQGRFPEAFAALEKAKERGCRENLLLGNTAIAQFLSGDIPGAYETLRFAESKGIPFNPALRNKILGAVNAGK